MTDLDALRRRAEELGAQTSYADVRGDWHDADPVALAVVVEQLDADAAGSGVLEPVVVTGRDGTTVAVDGQVTDAELVLHDGTVVTLPRPVDGAVVLPGDLPFGCHELRVETHGGTGASTVVVAPPTMPRAAAIEGRSGVFVPAYALWDDDHPLPSFTLLGRLAQHLARLDTRALTTLPLYAAFLDEPFDPSPYAPASRLHWNELYVDDHTLPAAPVPEMGRYVDWATLATRRRGQLLDAAGALDADGVAELERFVAARPDVADFARFMTTRRGAPADPLVERSHVLGQLLADRQLAELSRSGGATLAIDMPIGCHPDGFERWANPELFASGVTIGAPPDIFFAEGQDWGLPPQLPAAGRRSGHRLWQQLLQRAGEHASLLRIDHVMAVHRLWWVPAGFGPHQGVYVRYPREELLAVIAATAATTDTTVVGEDLGTVPEEVFEAMERWRMLGMYEEQFHTDDDPLAHIAERTVAGIRTHDMPAFAEYVAEQGDRLDAYRRRLSDVFGREIGDSYGELLDAVLERLATCDASLVTVDLDDVLGIAEAHNVPGKVLEHTWRRRLDRSLTATMTDPEVERRLRLLADRRRG